MTPRQLKYFIEIARQLSFTKASVSLHITQPALSRQIQELESTLGVKLFTRSESGLTLTTAGRHLTERAPALLDAFRQVSLDVAALADAPAGSLRFGVPPSLCDLVTTPSVRQYTRQYPNVKLSVTEASSAELTELISAGVLDFAIVAPNGPPARFCYVPLITEQMYLASSPGALTRQKTLARPELLAPLRYIASRQPNSLRRILEESLAVVNCKPNVVLEANSVRIITQATAEGIGHCVLPYSAIASMVEEGKLEARPIPEVFVDWALLHVKNVELTPSVAALVDIIIEVAGAASAEGRWRGVRLPASSISTRSQNSV